MYSLRRIVLLTAFLFFGSGTRAVEPFSYQVLRIPQSINITGSWHRVINTEQEWATFHADYLLAQMPGSSPPAVDFTKYTLIVGGLGIGPSGRDLVIDRIVDDSAGPLVVLVLVRPGPLCSISADITSPTKAILIPKTSKKISFYTRNSIAPRC